MEDPALREEVGCRHESWLRHRGGHDVSGRPQESVFFSRTERHTRLAWGVPPPVAVCCLNTLAHNTAKDGLLSLGSYSIQNRYDDSRGGVRRGAGEMRISQTGFTLLGGVMLFMHLARLTWVDPKKLSSFISSQEGAVQREIITIYRARNITYMPSDLPQLQGEGKMLSAALGDGEGSRDKICAVAAGPNRARPRAVGAGVESSAVRRWRSSGRGRGTRGTPSSHESVSLAPSVTFPTAPADAATATTTERSRNMAARSGVISRGGAAPL